MSKIAFAAPMRFAVLLQRVVFVVLLGIGGFGSGFASAQSYAFSTISVEGNQRIETATILSFLGLTRGEAVSGGALNEAAQRIRETGLFETVEIVPQGNTLVIRVVEFPTINRVNFEGNQRLSDSELAAVVRSQSRRVYSPAQAESDVTAIAEAYAQQGRVNATVTPRIIRRNDNRVDLVFEVFEGGITEIESIGFVGNRSFSDRRLRGVLETKQAGALRAIIQRDTFVADRIEFDKQVLVDFYKSRGFADMVVQSVDVSLTRTRDAYLITFNVQEGQRFQFGEVYVSSDLPDVDPLEFEAAIKTRPGQTYSPLAVDTDIARLERLALQKGLQFVQVEPRITRDDRNLKLNLELALVRGPRLFVERIDIEGNNTTLDRVVRNQFRVVEGDPFNPRSIRESAERIRALSYFSNADVQAREGSSPDQVVVDVNVTEAPTGSLSFGANYNSDIGLSLIASYKERNFLGRGQSLNFQLSTAETNRILSLDFNEPNLLGRDLGFGLELGYRVTNNENSQYDTETFRFSPSLSFPVSEKGRLAVFYALDYTDISDVDAAASPYIIADGAIGGVLTNSLGYTYSWDSRRTGLNPNAGVLLRFGQEFGVGDAQFIKTTASAVAETKVLNEEVTLRAAFDGGLLSYGSGASRITDRFFMGSRYMRGFAAAGIGPRDATTGDALGGNVFAVIRLESEFPLGLPEEYGITGGAFVDYGSLWDPGVGCADVLYCDFTPRGVAGLSMFWKTPVGPLRFNWTTAFDAQTDDITKNFDVTISTSF